MTWLKKMGQIILKIVGIASGLLPLVAPALPKTGEYSGVGDRLATAFKAIITAEQMFTAAYGMDAQKGSDKLKAATPFVTQLVESVIAELPHAGHVKDVALFSNAVEHMTSAMADILNAVGD